MSNLKETILENMTYADYRRYYEQELGELGKMNSSGWVVCLCPFHDDTNPSLNVDFFAEGAFKCHACGETGDLFSFHQKKHGTDFKGALDYFAGFLGIDPDSVPKKTKKKTKSKTKLKAKKPLGPPSVIYQYKNLTGKVICETCRYDNPVKDFRQRRPHPTKKGEYLWNLKTIKIIPYNLKAVVESDTLYIVEGEKDADRIIQIGLTATCNPMGAGVWPDNLTPYFKDKNIIILPDNDDPGKKHSELVASKLKGTAKLIQIVNLPNLKNGQDISDWLSAGNTKADLLEVIKNQKPFEDHIDFLNKNHAVITIAGKTQILNEDIDRDSNRPTISFSSLKDLHMKYANRLIPNPDAGSGVKGQRKFINIVTDWIKSSDRRQYEDIVFAPQQEIPGCYNLWRGFAVEPKDGNWGLFSSHIYKVIANENKKIYEWIITWMAKIVQDLGKGKRPETSLALRGDQGTGKTFFLENFGYIFGNHYLEISNQAQLTGRFNNHFKSVILLAVDEGFWAGDKAGEGVIKSLITGSHLVIEPKGQDVFRIKNRMNIVFASNNEWVIPAGLRERRFMVIDVSDSHKEDKKYFNVMKKQLKNGGYEAMLHYLLEYDTSKVDVSRIFNTAAMFSQKLESMNPIQKFWFEKLRSGQLQDSDAEWSGLIQSEVLYSQYCDFCSMIGVRHRKINIQFGIEIRKLCPEMERKKIKTVDIGADNYVYKWHYELPPLENCRNALEMAAKTEIDWDNDSIFIDDEFEQI